MHSSFSFIDLICNVKMIGQKLSMILGSTIRAIAGQRSSPDLCFATKSIKSMTKDIDLNVTQVGCDGTV